MADKTLPLIVRPAPRGSKKDWCVVTADIPPATLQKLDELAIRRGSYRGPLIHEAIEKYLAAQAA